MLLRHYIGQRLAAYYAQPSDKVVGSVLDHALKYMMQPDALFNSPAVQFPLWGHWHWNLMYHSIFKEQSGQWLTPVELFAPFYSQIIANFIQNEMSRWERSFDIVELGGGRGTNAIISLLYLEKQFPILFSNIQNYFILDSSSTLLDLQKNQIMLLNRPDIQSKIQLLQVDIAKAAESNENPLRIPYSDKPTVVIGLEILDNLPQDQIMNSQHKIYQAQIHENLQSPPDIIWTQIDDTLLKYVIQLLPEKFNYNTGSDLIQWVPTCAAGLLQKLLHQRPLSSILFADFDYLPPPTFTTASVRRRPQQGKQKNFYDPLITDMNGVDHECLFTAPPFCDILFPTDFQTLATLLERQEQALSLSNDHCKSNIRVMKQTSFLLEYGRNIVHETRNLWTGYTPLLGDFSNCSVIIRSTFPTSKYSA